MIRFAIKSGMMKTPKGFLPQAAPGSVVETGRVVS
jgi:hypothetical protein